MPAGRSRGPEEGGSIRRFQLHHNSMPCRPASKRLVALLIWPKGASIPANAEFALADEIDPCRQKICQSPTRACIVATELARRPESPIRLTACALSRNWTDGSDR